MRRWGILLIWCALTLGTVRLAAASDSHTAGNHDRMTTKLDESDDSRPEGPSVESLKPDGTQPDLSGHVHTTLPDKSKLAGIDEKLGDTIPENIMFYDELGRMVDVRSLIDRPTIIAPVYFTCPTVCNILQSQIAKLLPQLSLDPTVYRVLSISFDERDTPQIAERKMRQYFAAMNNAFPQESWRFLVGDKASVDALMGSVGFSFTRTGKDFVHPVALIVTSPEGKIVRYLYGNSFLPFDLTMALTEAQEGKVGLSLRRIVAYCFSYDPAGRKYVFNFMRVAGGSVLAGALILFVVLSTGGRRRKK